MFVPGRSTLRNRLSRGDRIGAIWLSLGSPALAEAAANARAEAIVIDMQHGLWSRREMEAAIGVVPPEIPVLVRVADNSAVAIAEALDAGAEGVIVPLVETAKQARKAVRFAKYPPSGIRSGGGFRPLAEFADYVESARHGTVVIVMIETKRGLKNAKKIAKTEGVDMVFIGTGDLALSLETFPNPDHRHNVACAEIHRACQEAWTPCGIFTGTIDAAIRRRDQGYRMVVIANDIGLVQAGFSQAVAAHARKPAPPAIEKKEAPALATPARQDAPSDAASVKLKS